MFRMRLLVAAGEIRKSSETLVLTMSISKQEAKTPT